METKTSLTQTVTNPSIRLAMSFTLLTIPICCAQDPILPDPAYQRPVQALRVQVLDHHPSHTQNQEAIV